MQLVLVADDLQLAALDELGERRYLPEALHGHLDVLLDRGVEHLIGGLTLDRLDRLDRRDDGRRRGADFSRRDEAEYSMLPMRIGSGAVFPATRTTKRSPRPSSITTSGARRESEHVRMIAKGFCPWATSVRRTESRRGLVVLPCTKRLLPARSRASALSGVLGAGAFGAVANAKLGAPTVDSVPAATAPPAAASPPVRNFRRDVSLITLPHALADQ